MERGGMEEEEGLDPRFWGDRRPWSVSSDCSVAVSAIHSPVCYISILHSVVDRCYIITLHITYEVSLIKGPPKFAPRAMWSNQWHYSTACRRTLANVVLLDVCRRNKLPAMVPRSVMDMETRPNLSDRTSCVRVELCGSVQGLRLCLLTIIITVLPTPKFNDF